MPTASELVAARGVAGELRKGRRGVGVVVAARGRGGFSRTRGGRGGSGQAKRRRAPAWPGIGELHQAELRRGTAGRGAAAQARGGRTRGRWLRRGAGRGGGGSGAELQRPRAGQRRRLRRGAGRPGAGSAAQARGDRAREEGGGGGGSDAGAAAPARGRRLRPGKHVRKKVRILFLKKIGIFLIELTCGPHSTSANSATSALESGSHCQFEHQFVVNFVLVDIATNLPYTCEILQFKRKPTVF
jgi:hypothetical protein